MAVRNKSEIALGWHQHDVLGGGRCAGESVSDRAQSLRNHVQEVYGYGDAPTWRIKFYDRLQSALVRQPKALIPLVHALMIQAKNCEHPDRFFCKCFTREAEKLNAWAVE